MVEFFSEINEIERINLKHHNNVDNHLYWQASIYACMTINLSPCMSVNLFACPLLRLSTSACSLRFSVGLSLSLSVCLSVCLSLHPPRPFFLHPNFYYPEQSLRQRFFALLLYKYLVLELTNVNSFLLCICCLCCFIRSLLVEGKLCRTRYDSGVLVSPLMCGPEVSRTTSLK